jgi:hypothetical protein
MVLVLIDSLIVLLAAAVIGVAAYLIDNSVE